MALVFAGPGGCTAGKIAANLLHGPVAEGRKRVCFTTLLDPGGLEGPQFVTYVYDLSIAATYLTQVVVRRGASEDVAVCTHHWRWDGGSDPVEADLETIEDRIRDFWDAVKPLIYVGYVADEVRWYWADPSPGPPNPTFQVSTIGVAGTALGPALPPQVSCTITERNDVRRRWGRFYLPGLTVSALEGDGHLKDSYADQIAAAASSLYDQGNANWKAVTFGAPTPHSLQVRAVSVDDILDVQRRRRFETVGYRATIDL